MTEAELKAIEEEVERISGTYGEQPVRELVRNSRTLIAAVRERDKKIEDVLAMIAFANNQIIAMKRELLERGGHSSKCFGERCYDGLKNKHGGETDVCICGWRSRRAELEKEVGDG